MVSETVAELTDQEYGPLSYLKGSFISKMLRSSKKKYWNCIESNKEEQQNLQQSLKRPDNDCIVCGYMWHDKSLSRGGLWTPCEDLIAIGLEAEKEFRIETTYFDVTKVISVREISSKIFSMPKLKSLWNNIIQACPCPVSRNCSKMCLENVIFLYQKIRSFSFSKDKINKYRKQNGGNS